jgi:hypothetical protein
MRLSDRLDSWKEISRYIERDVGTCTKWAKNLGFPVYRIDKNSRRSSVFAFRSEIDRWFRERAK